MSDVTDPLSWVERDVKRLNTLSDYAVKVRYPGDDPTPDEAHETVEIAKVVRRFARVLLDIK